MSVITVLKNEHVIFQTPAPGRVGGGGVNVQYVLCLLYMEIKYLFLRSKKVIGHFTLQALEFTRPFENFK